MKWNPGPRVALAAVLAFGGALTTTVALAASAAPAPGAALPDYVEWTAACRRLPTNRELRDRLATKERLPLRTYAEFAAVLNPFLELSRTGALAHADAWLEGAPQAQTFFNLDTGYYARSDVPFQPFAQRYQVPAGTRVFLHGDLHGDIHALVAYLDALNKDGDLDGFGIARPEVRLAFLGDYTDRGKYGVEVLYTLMRLKLANPDRVLLVRGNHEDMNLVARYGFLAEATGKYGRDFDVRRVVRLYDFLPAVLYLACGTNVVQCNHGGLEPGYNPTRLLASPAATAFQLLGRLEQRTLLAARPGWTASLPPAARRQLEGSLTDFVPLSPTTPNVLGFMWNDFTVVSQEPQFAVDPGRAFVYGEQVARILFDQANGSGSRIRALFRAHQHAPVLNPMMRRLVASRGIFRHWQATDSAALLEAPTETLQDHLEGGLERSIPDGSVWTFNVSPDSVYGEGCGFTFDTAGELLTAEHWDDWRLRILNLQISSTR